jgi:hypothetical protein
MIILLFWKTYNPFKPMNVPWHTTAYLGNSRGIPGPKYLLLLVCSFIQNYLKNIRVCIKYRIDFCVRSCFRVSPNHYVSVKCCKSICIPKMAPFCSYTSYHTTFEDLEANKQCCTMVKVLLSVRILFSVFPNCLQLRQSIFSIASLLLIYSHY